MTNTKVHFQETFDEECLNFTETDPRYNLIFLRAQQNYANDMLISRGHVLVNDVYDMVGFKRTREGAIAGWVRDYDHKVDFGVEVLENGQILINLEADEDILHAM